MLDIAVDGLPPMKLRALTRREMAVVLTTLTQDSQDEIMRDVLGGTKDALDWYQSLPHPVAMQLTQVLIDATLERARAREVAQAGESFDVARTSDSASTSRENSG